MEHLTLELRQFRLGLSKANLRGNESFDELVLIVARATVFSVVYRISIASHLTQERLRLLHLRRRRLQLHIRSNDLPANILLETVRISFASDDTFSASAAVCAAICATSVKCVEISS